MTKDKIVSEWLESKFIEWIAQTGQRRTVKEFAEWLDISRTVVSRYLSGDRIPTRKNADKIAARLGPEIYDLLGLQRPDPLLQEIQANWSLLTETEQQQISDMINDAVERHKKNP